MVSSQAVLVVAVVNRNLDGNRRINQTDDGGWDANEVGVTSVSCASKSKSTLLVFNHK